MTAKKPKPPAKKTPKRKAVRKKAPAKGNGKAGKENGGNGNSSRNEVGQFVDGWEGGPGRPKGGGGITAPLKALARQHTEAAVNKAAHIMTNTNDDKAALIAVNILLDRGHGKPTQLMGEDPEFPSAGASIDLSKLSDEKLEALRALLREARKDD